MDSFEKIFTDELESELLFSFSRSGGPGGQNVNKVNTKVELRFDIAKSLVLTDAQKEILLDRLARQISSDGSLIIISQATRSQLQNKEDAIAKFYDLLNKSLKPIKKRKPKTISKAAKENRLKEKIANSEKKERRRFRI
jgi:ribosome-associated protein